MSEFENNKARKNLEDLTMMDDDFMCLMFNGNLELTEYVLRTVLEKKLHVVKVEVQRQIFNGVKRRIILDILAVDDEGKHYNIEIQKSNEGANPKRARYHSSRLDSTMLEKGKYFDELEDNFVIFFTENDIFGGDLPIYHVKRVILEMNKEVEDGSSIIYVNCAYLKKHPIPSSELEKLIHDFQCNKVEELYSDEIRERMIDVREDGVTTMSEWAENIYEEAMNQGLLQGSNQKTMAVIQNLSNLNMSIDFISKAVNLSVDDVKYLMKKTQIVEK